jgi:hypothetical protein
MFSALQELRLGTLLPNAYAEQSVPQLRKQVEYCG